MKKILVIGAGIGQINIVKLARAKGFHVTVVSIKGDYPCISLADEFFECDIYDRDSIVKYAIENQIDAVISDQNDLMMPTVAYVAEKLSLPGNTFEQQLSYTDKNKFRCICDNLNVPVPEHIAVNSSSLPIELKAPMPWIIKPADSQSSIGITKISSISEYSGAVELALSKSKKYEAIIEEFFVGTEFVCEGFIYKGKYYNLMFGDRRYFEGTLLPCQTLFPTNILPESIQNQIIDCETKIAAEVNPSFGIVHSEYLVNMETGEFRIIDTALRGGGVYISSHLVPLTTNIDINTVLLNCALGEEIAIDKIMSNKKVKASAYVCFNLPEGVINTVAGIDEVKAMPNVAFFDDSSIKVGLHTGKMEVKGNRKGPIIINANDRQELDEVINKIKETLSICVFEDNRKTQIIWN